MLNSLEAYPTVKLEGQIGLEFTHAIGDVANRQLKLKRYAEAELSYQKVLELVSHLVYLDIKECDRIKALSYHNLGRVAEEQRQREQAREYFLQALETYVAYDDSHSGGIVLSSLARLGKASSDVNLPAAVATILGYSVEETEKLFREMLGEE